MIKFPSIEQFRHVSKKVSWVFDGERPILDFHGTVKLHGTNAAIVVDDAKDSSELIVTLQSRNNVITPESDNAGFATYMTEEVGREAMLDITHSLWHPGMTKIVVYGEWCGGNIQKGIAISGGDKMFVIFAVKGYFNHSEDGSWIDISKHAELLCDKDNRIFNSEMFDTHDITIDFSNPELSINELVAITEHVEKECPVGKHFGLVGIGEGVVWRCKQDPTSELWFKVKGEKHSVTKVKKLADVDPEKVKTVCEFVDRTVTQNRIDQGIEYLTEQGMELSRKSTGPFLSWFFADIMKEELDVMEASGLTKKDVSSKIGNKARGMFFGAVDF